jgi:hypothetical protein
MLIPQKFIAGEVMNISASGAFIHCLAAPRNEESFRLLVNVLPEMKTFLADVVLVRSNISSCHDDLSSCGIGVRFTEAFGNGRDFFSKCEHVSELESIMESEKGSPAIVKSKQ